MALQKQSIPLNFSQGLDSKTDPYQVQMGKFLTLVNSVFTTGDRLTKRNGFAQITSLPNANQTNLTTLNDNLIATGSNLYAFSADTNQWLNQGTIQPIQLNTLPLCRISTSQTSPDTAVAKNGLVCLVYMDSGTAFYQISDSNTGQQIIPRTPITGTAGAGSTLAPRVFILGMYFIVTFLDSISATPHLQYISIPLANPTNPSTAVNISSDVKSTSAGYDGFVINNNLYLAWATAGNAIDISFMSSSLILSASESITGATADYLSVTGDTSINRVWVSFWDSGSTNGYSALFDFQLNQVMANTQIITTTSINALTTISSSGVLKVFYENANSYAFSGGAESDFISTLTVTPPISGTGVGTASSTTVVLRSVGLASKPFFGTTGILYLLVTYGDTDQSPSTNDSNQPTYFLIDSLGNIYMKLAYSNGGGYAANQVLPTVSTQNSKYYVPYLFKDFLTTVNKVTVQATGLPATPVNAIYSQTGVNLAEFTINDSTQYSSEIAGSLHLTGGQLWMYDSVKPVEHGFDVWPENIVATTVTGSGNITANTYNYAFTYEWTDNQGNLHRSAPSIPTVVITTTSSSTNTIHVPTLRLTYKTPPNPVRIVGYRWSVSQPVFYQFTSVTSPTLNSTTTDFVTFTDTLADSSILGNAILYTTGGVIENIGAPASVASALFKNRLFIVDAEDQNLLWFSKQVIEAVPVEMSDLLTIYIAPTSGAQGSTGPITALSAMDDKLIIFKRDAIYYITGTGPDNTGASNDFSDPIFITANVGCANPNSIVLMPNGIMFQSDKGIWLLGRDLSTNYIGAPVEQFNSLTVVSAKAIPGTNQLRFILSNNTMLMYDYYYNQWGTFTSQFAISSTLHNSTHTYLSKFGTVFEETPGVYLDGTSPVLMNFTTAWINIAGLQGFERFYFLYLLGTYFTPFNLNVQIAYNYNPNPLQLINVAPDNFSANWGGEAQWGSGQNWGGGTGDGSSADSSVNVFEARIFPAQQKCEAFQIQAQEIYDATKGVTAGQGLTLSGLNLVIGTKRGFRTQRAAKSFG